MLQTFHFLKNKNMKEFDIIYTLILFYESKIEYSFMETNQAWNDSHQLMT